MIENLTMIIPFGLVIDTMERVIMVKDWERICEFYPKSKIQILQDFKENSFVTSSESLNKLENLLNEKWIDDRTLAVALQFTLMHAPTSLFSTVKLITEWPPTGKTSCSIQISTTYLYKYISYWDNFILACEVRETLKIIYIQFICCM